VRALASSLFIHWRSCAPSAAPNDTRGRHRWPPAVAHSGTGSLGDSGATRSDRRGNWTALTCSLRFSRAREKRGTCRTGRRILFREILFGEIARLGANAGARAGWTRAIGANAAAVGGAGCGDGRAQLRGRRLDGRRLLRTAGLSVVLSLYPLAPPRAEPNEEKQGDCWPIALCH
jgi:hypothetical protein